MKFHSLIQRSFFSAIFLFSLLGCFSGQTSFSFGGQRPGGPEDGGGEIPNNPVEDPKFDELPNGKKLSSIKVRGSSLTLSKGTGTTFGRSQWQSYLRLKEQSQTRGDGRLEWTIRDLDKGEILAGSSDIDDRIFGASVSKIYVGGALLDHQEGDISSSQLQLMADMLVVSSNSAWTNLQRQIGNGDSNLGRQRIHRFTQGLGYEKTQGFQGWWGNLHGNELTARELGEFLEDTYKRKYEGADYLWKMLHTVRTGTSRARKYIPRTLFVGGKTGSYAGGTFDTDIPASVNVNVRNHAITFFHNGTQYAISILNNTGSEENAALIAGGLFQEYVLKNRAP